MQHLYKSRLQNYAHKRNLTLPTYSCEIMGPPHARLFKSKVTVDGKSYEASNYFPKIKDAENAAAKVAFESMSLHETQEDEGLYKTLLQEFAQKEGLLFPAYETNKSGPPHIPVFISTVEIGAESFEGLEGKTKRLAESNAAKVAYTSLRERGARRFASSQERDLSTVSSPGEQVKGVAGQFTSGQEKQHSTVSSRLEEVKGVARRCTSDQEIQHSTVSSPLKEVKETNINGKRNRCSVTSEDVFDPLQDPLLCSLTKDGTSSENRTRVCHHKLNMMVPDGANILPCSND